MKPTHKHQHKGDSKPTQRTQSGEVRIIGGLWKRSKLGVPAVEGLRPSPDRVRETLFNWLASIAGGDLDNWHVIDVFAGTGALGLEAASRGAHAVILCERHPKLIQQLQANCARLQATQAPTVRVTPGDGLQTLRRLAPQSQDLVLLDPPFNTDLTEPALQAATKAIKPQGVIYLENPKKWDEAELAGLGLKTYRHLKAGAVHAHLLQKLGLG